jgi:hypothetical protein
MDGWFLFANLIEYVELCYYAWKQKKDKCYREKIEARASTINRVKGDYEYPDLKGRWELIQGNLKVDDAISTGGEESDILFSEALQHYKRGFPQIALGYIGSHGVVALSSEFDKLKEVIRTIPVDTHKKWFEELNLAWGNVESEFIQKERQENSLQALLTDLYMDLLD